MDEFTRSFRFFRDFFVFLANTIRKISIALFCFVLIASVLFGAVFFWAAYIDSCKKDSMERDFDFRNVKTVVLEIGDAKYDMSRDKEFLDALSKVRRGHWIVGRSEKSIMSGYLIANGTRFEIWASTLYSGKHLYRATLSSENNGRYEGAELGEELFFAMMRLKAGGEVVR